MVDVERRQNYMTLSKVASVVRAEVDIHERIANKGLGDPMLEQVIAFALVKGKKNGLYLQSEVDDATKSGSFLCIFNIDR